MLHLKTIVTLWFRKSYRILSLGLNALTASYQMSNAYEQGWKASANVVG
jgi:hypothetical protein